MEDAALNDEPVVDGPLAGERPVMPAPGDAVGQPSGTHPALPVLDDAARSPVHGVCPFLRGEAAGALVAPVPAPREGQACVAIGAPRPQSTSQQELVCLRATHVDCPRYQRGSMAPAQAPARTRPTVPRATLAALLILVLSAGISLGYVVQRGGLDLPLVGPAATDAGVAVVASASPALTGAPEATEAPVMTESPLLTAGPTSGPSVEVSTEPSTSVEPAPTPAATATPELTAAPTPAPTAGPTAKPTPKPTATAKPKPTATPKPRSDRYKLLTKCPDRSNCWIYVVRSGDNLFSIGKYFGHSLATLYQWNPQYPGTRLKVGAEIRMPPPTR